MTEPIDDLDSELEAFDKWEHTGEVASEAGVAAFSPTNRPPMSVLVAFDDGCTTGEVFRLRKDNFTIGSFDADCVIPHDPAIDEKHLSIRRSRASDGWVWTIENLSKTSGLYVRASKFKLRDRSEFLAGKYRYIFKAPEDVAVGSTSSLSKRLENGSIPGVSVFDQEVRYPCLSQLSEEPTNNKIWLISGTYWLGRSGDCALSVADDQFLADYHVEISQASRGWTARTYNVPNGMWGRLRKITVRNTCTFQIGEQRFRLYTEPKSRHGSKGHQAG